MIHVSLVPKEHIADIWGDINEYMQGAADYTYGRFSVEDIREGAETQDQQLWIAFEGVDVYGAVITEVVTYPRKKALLMHFTGGKQLSKWKPQMLAVLQRFARDNDCSIIESYGRIGWAKVFENDGFKSKFMFYELPVEGE
jgi:hypothetical protein